MKKLRILVVDDDHQNRKLLEIILSCEGYAPIIIASDGEMAINMLQGNQYDLVMTDLNMPKADGLEVTTFVKRYFPNTKVILLTAFRDEIKPEGAAPDRIIRKPYDIKEVRDAISELFPN